MSIYLFKLSV